MKRLALLASAAAVYLVAAWMVAPGFYEGFTPPSPYNWICPPPIAGASSGIQPASGHLTIKVIGGISDPNTVFTDDGQVAVGFLPGAFGANGKTQITVDVTPVSPCPTSTDLHFTTNVYRVTADAKLVMKANLVMRYSNLIPAPSFVYRAADVGGPWTSLGGQEGQLYTIQATSSELGYFVAGYPANATSQGSGTSQLLPIAVAVLIVGVLIAGIPLAMARRRRAAGEDGSDETDDS